MHSYIHTHLYIHLYTYITTLTNSTAHTISIQLTILFEVSAPTYISPVGCFLNLPCTCTSNRRLYIVYICKCIYSVIYSMSKIYTVYTL